MRIAQDERNRIFEVDDRNMFNQFGSEARDILVSTESDGFGREEVERHITELIADFSRTKSSRSRIEAEKETQQPDKEKEQPADAKAAPSGAKEYRFNELLNQGLQTENFESKQDELRRLQDDLDKVKREREELSARLAEIERKTIHSEEDLRNILAEKQAIEEKNQELQSANETALNKIRALTQEKADAVLGESEAMEKYLHQLKENDDLVAEINNLKSINEKLNEEMDREYEASQSAETESAETDNSGNSDEQTDYDSESVNDFEAKYGKELVTDSGMELFMMLRGILQDDTRDNSGVRMTKTWEEELEETIPGEFPEDKPITRKVRTKSEISVEYIAGQKPGI